jgi:hypothetical protein
MKVPLRIQGVYKRTQKQREQKRREIRKKTHKDPTTAENPKHPRKNPKNLYNITSQ